MKCFPRVLAIRGKVRKQTVRLLAQVLNTTSTDCNIKGKDLSPEIMLTNNNPSPKINSAHAKHNVTYWRHSQRGTQSHLHGTDTLKGKNECHVNNRTTLRTIFSYFLRQGLL